MKASDLGEYFKIEADNRNLNYDKYFNLGMEKSTDDEEEYTSFNTNQLDVEKLTSMIKNLGIENILE
jgi:UDP-glucose 4-epimerase